MIILRGLSRHRPACHSPRTCKSPRVPTFARRCQMAARGPSRSNKIPQHITAAEIPCRRRTLTGGRSRFRSAPDRSAHRRARLALPPGPPLGAGGARRVLISRIEKKTNLGARPNLRIESLNIWKSGPSRLAFPRGKIP